MKFGHGRIFWLHEIFDTDEANGIYHYRKCPSFKTLLKNAKTTHKRVFDDRHIFEKIRQQLQVMFFSGFIAATIFFFGIYQFYSRTFHSPVFLGHYISATTTTTQNDNNDNNKPPQQYVTFTADYDLSAVAVAIPNPIKSVTHEECVVCREHRPSVDYYCVGDIKAHRVLCNVCDVQYRLSKSSLLIICPCCRQKVHTAIRFQFSQSQ